MAKAIKQIRRVDPTPEEVQAQELSELTKALAENGNALIKIMSIVNQLDNMGVLNALDGLLKARIDVAEIALGQINQPMMQNVIKNGMNMFKFLGAIEPNQLQTLLGGVSHGIDKTTNHPSEKTSLWQLGKSMRTPEVRHSLATMVGFLEGMGEFMQNNKERLH